ncbi:MAG: enoyl-CoA hydratase/isomerase family protein, partial [Polymorphobacter sp.]
MSENDMLYAVADGVATITFNRPDKLNALTPAMLGQFFAHVDAAAADGQVRVIVITGAGRGFCAGLDLAVIGSGVGGKGVGAPPAATPKLAPQWGDDIGPAMQRFYAGGWNGLITSRKPTIAAINGPVFGWGFILALHCDIRFAARSALFNATFARLGIPGEKNAAWLLS